MQTVYTQESPHGSAQRPPNPTISRFTSTVVLVGKFCFLITLAGVWFVVGLLGWAFMLVRALSAFAFGLLYSMFTHQDMSSIQDQLEYVCGFWVRGFQQIYNAIYRGGNQAVPKMYTTRLAIETLGTSMAVVATIVLTIPERVERSIPAFSKLATEFSAFYVGLTPAWSIILCYAVGSAGGIVSFLLTQLVARNHQNRATGNTGKGAPHEA